MDGTIRRTIVVEYESNEHPQFERDCVMVFDRKSEWWVGQWPADAQIRETVEEITEAKSGNQDATTK